MLPCSFVSTAVRGHCGTNMLSHTGSHVAAVIMLLSHCSPFQKNAVSITLCENTRWANVSYASR